MTVDPIPAEYFTLAPEHDGEIVQGYVYDADGDAAGNVIMTASTGEATVSDANGYYCMICDSDSVTVSALSEDTLYVGSATAEDGVVPSMTLEEGNVTKYDVTFNYYGAPAESVEVVEGATVAQPTDPTRSGYVFTGWKVGSDVGVDFDFDTEITGDLQLYTSWRDANSVTVDITVVDESDNYVQGASIKLGDSASATTGIYGAAQFNSVDEGTHSLIVSKDGYRTVSQSVVVGEDTEDMEIEVVMVETTAEEVRQWATIDIDFEGTVPGDSNAFMDTAGKVNVVFTHTTTGATASVNAFYRDNGVWTVRFSPDTLGEWTYEVSYNEDNDYVYADDYYDPAKTLPVDESEQYDDEYGAIFDGLTGSTICIENDNELMHGGVIQDPDNLQHFIYQDGTPYIESNNDYDDEPWLTYADTMYARYFCDRYSAYNVILDMGKESYNLGWTAASSITNQPENEGGGFYVDTMIREMRAFNDYYNRIITVHDWDTYYTYLNYTATANYYDTTNGVKDANGGILDMVQMIGDQVHLDNGDGSSYDYYLGKLKSFPDLPFVNVESAYQQSNNDSNGGDTGHYNTYGASNDELTPEAALREYAEATLAGVYWAHYYTNHAWDILKYEEIPDQWQYMNNLITFISEDVGTDIWAHMDADDSLITGSTSGASSYDVASGLKVQHAMATEGTNYLVYTGYGTDTANKSAPSGMDTVTITFSDVDASKPLSGIWYNLMTGETQEIATTITTDGQYTFTVPSTGWSDVETINGTAQQGSGEGYMLYFSAPLEAAAGDIIAVTDPSALSVKYGTELSTITGSLPTTVTASFRALNTAPVTVTVLNTDGSYATGAVVTLDDGADNAVSDADVVLAGVLEGDHTITVTMDDMTTVTRYITIDDVTTGETVITYMVEGSGTSGHIPGLNLSIYEDLTTLDVPDGTVPDYTMVYEDDFSFTYAKDGVIWNDISNENFSATFDGEIYIETAGTYTFYMEVAAAARLTIDGTKIFEKTTDSWSAASDQTGSIYLDAGYHTFTVDMFQVGYAFTGKLYWGNTSTTVPSSVLFQPGAAAVVTYVAPLDSKTLDVGTVYSDASIHNGDYAVILSDGTTATAQVAWDTVSFDAACNTPGEFTMYGTLSEVENPGELKASITVTFVNTSGASAYEVTVNSGDTASATYYEGATVTITADAAEDGYRFASWTTESNITLPATVSVTMSDGTTDTLVVVWTCADYDATTAGTYTFTGTLTESTYVTNSSERTASIEVTVLEQVTEINGVYVEYFADYDRGTDYTEYPDYTWEPGNGGSFTLTDSANTLSHVGIPDGVATTWAAIETDMATDVWSSADGPEFIYDDEDLMGGTNEGNYFAMRFTSILTTPDFDGTYYFKVNANDAKRLVIYDETGTTEIGSYTHWNGVNAQGACNTGASNSLSTITDGVTGTFAIYNQQNDIVSVTLDSNTKYLVVFEFAEGKDTAFAKLQWMYDCEASAVTTALATNNVMGAGCDDYLIPAEYFTLPEAYTGYLLTGYLTNGADATVTASSVTTTADANGFYAITVPTTGSVELTATTEGYAVTETVAVTGDLGTQIVVDPLTLVEVTVAPDTTLANAKTAAKTEIADYADASNYYEAQQTELTTAIADANTAIEAAETTEAVATALAAAKTAIDAIDTKTEVDAEAIFTITFDAGSGTASAASVDTDTDGTLDTLPTASRSGYNFKGWYLTDGTQMTTETVDTNGSVTTATETTTTTAEGATVEENSTTIVDEETKTEIAATVTTEDGATTSATLVATATDDTAAVTIPQAVLTTVADEATGTVTIQAQEIEIQLDETATNTVAEAAVASDDDQIIITAEKVDESVVADEHLADLDNVTVVDLTITVGGETVSDFNSGAAKISIPYTATSENANITVYYVDNDGAISTVKNATYTGSAVTFLYRAAE